MAETTSRKSRRWPLILGGIIVSVILFLTLLPTVMSSQWGKQQLLGLAASHIPGELSVDSWSLNWLGGQKIASINYTDAGIRLHTEEVTIAKGIFSLLMNPDDIGTINVIRPDVQVLLPDPEQEQPSPRPEKTYPGQTTADQGESPQPETQKTPDAKPVTLPAIRGKLVAEEGAISIMQPGGEVEPVAKGIKLEVDLASLSDNITYSLAAASPNGKGNLSGAGKVAVKPGNTIPESLHPTGDLVIDSWDLNRLLELAASLGSAPTGTGRLDTKVTYSGSLAQGIIIDGTINLSDLKLSGGPLGDDQPYLDTTSLVFSASAGQDIVELTSLTLSSPIANGQLTAVADTGGSLQLNSDLRIDLNELAQQIPRTLNLQEGIKITDGALVLEVEANSAQGDSEFKVNALIDNLAGVRKGKKISLAEPFTFSLQGQQGKSGLNLNHFSVRSSFLEGKGQGNLDDMHLSMQADIGAALVEISKFIALQDYRAGGLLNLSIEAKRKDDATVTLSAMLDADKLTLQQQEKLIIPSKPLQVELESDLLLSQDFFFSGVVASKLAYQTWLGQGSMAVQEIMLDSDRKLKGVEDLAVSGRLRLHDIGVLLESLEVTPEPIKLSGQSDLQLKVSGEDGRFFVKEFRISSQKFSAHKGKQQLIPESTLNIQGNSQVILTGDGKPRSLDTPKLSYTTWLGSGHIEAARVDLPTKKVSGLVYSGNTDLDKLSGLLSALEVLPPGLSFSGSETSNLKMNYSPKGIEIVSQHRELENFSIEQDGKSYRDKLLVIDAAGTFNMENRKVSLSTVTVDSANGKVSIDKLTVDDWDKLADTLISSGEAQFDLKTVLEAARDWINIPPDVSTIAGVDVSWTVDPSSGPEYQYQLVAKLDNFSLAKAGVQTFSDEQLSLQLDGLRNPTTGIIDLKQLNIASPLINLDTKGTLNIGTDSEIAMQGNLAMDLSRLASLIQTFSDMDLEMSGKSDRPFELTAKAEQQQQKNWLQHTDFLGAFQADLIKMLGIEVQSLEVPLRATEGTAQAEIKGSVNEGTLDLQPRVDLTTTPPILTLPDDSLVLHKMQLTREMTNQLLARIHPLFMGVTQTSGSIDLHLEHFRLPLGKENLSDLELAGTMGLNEVQLGSSLLLGTLLNVLRVEETGVDLGNQQLHFACKDGRITTSPLRASLSETQFTISGSLGLDKTIDYQAQAEVTRSLVGGDLYKYLEGTTINIPIGGTLSNPDIPAKTVQRAVTDLINQAGQKKLQEAAESIFKKLF